MGRELRSPGARRAGRRGEARQESAVSDHGGRRTELGKTVEFVRFKPSRQAAIGVGVEKRTAVPMVASERRGEAPVDGGDESRGS